MSCASLKLSNCEHKPNLDKVYYRADGSPSILALKHSFEGLGIYNPVFVEESRSGKTGFPQPLASSLFPYD